MLVACDENGPNKWHWIS